MNKIRKAENLQRKPRKIYETMMIQPVFLKHIGMLDNAKVR